MAVPFSKRVAYRRNIIPPGNTLNIQLVSDIDIVITTLPRVDLITRKKNARRTYSRAKTIQTQGAIQSNIRIPAEANPENVLYNTHRQMIQQ